MFVDCECGLFRHPDCTGVCPRCGKDCDVLTELTPQEIEQERRRLWATVGRNPPLSVSDVVKHYPEGH